MGSGIAVLALALGLAAAAAGPASAAAPHPDRAAPAAARHSPEQPAQQGARPSPERSTTPAVPQATAVGDVGAAAAAGGSIVYISGNNVWLMAPDGTGKKQITHDGSASSPYLSPSESDDGTIVAIRNSTSADVGTIYVMNRAGRLVSRFTPPQYGYHGVGVSCSVDYQVAPTGIQRGTVSPDGSHIAYTAQAMFQNVGCSTVVNVYTSYVIGRTGTGAVHLSDIQAIDSSEVGGWAGNATILLSNMAFDDVKLYSVSVPGNHATLWKADTDEWDTAWEGPSRGGTLLATSGWSSAAAGPVVRLWNAPSLTSAPTVRCEIAATAGTSDPNVFGTPLAWPVGAAPDGTAVTWWETNGDTSRNTADEGIYVTAVPSAGCPSTKTLIASGASYPFWGSAAVSAPVAPNTAPVVRVTAKPAALLRSTSTAIGFTVTDTTDYAVAKTCTLDGRATTCTSPKALSGLAQGKHTFVITATDPVGAKGSATVSWTVDTVVPKISVSASPAVTLGTKIVFRWHGSDVTAGMAGYDVQYTTASYTGTFRPWATKLGGTRAVSWTLSGLKAGYEYCIRVRTRDRAGNVSGYSAASCTTRPMDDRSLTASHFTRRTVSYAFGRTESDASYAGATLTLAHARVGHLAVLATVSRAGGTLAVYVGSTKIGTVNLRASATRPQQVLWLHVVSPRTGTVTLRTPSKTPVRVDGLVDLRTP